MAKITDDNRGVTLLEVLVAVTIISLLAVAARPSAKNFLEGIRLWSAANAIKQQLSVAKTRALADPNVHAGVYFNTATIPDTVIAFLDDDATAPNDYVYTANKDHLLAPAYSIPKTDTLKIISGTNQVVFRGDGSTKASIQLTITNPKGNSYTISVLASTGRIKAVRN